MNVLNEMEQQRIEWQGRFFLPWFQNSPAIEDQANKCVFRLFCLSQKQEEGGGGREGEMFLSWATDSKEKKINCGPKGGGGGINFLF